MSIRYSRVSSICILLCLLFNHTGNGQADPILINNRPVTTYVNPFIGTANGGNTFPGAVVPRGKVSVSQKFADEIKASGFTRNAAEAVPLVKKLLGIAV